MSRDEQRVNGVELKPLARRAARHRLNPFLRLGDIEFMRFRFLSWHRANAPEVVRARHRAVCKQENPADSHRVRLLADPIDLWRKVEGAIQSVSAGRVTD